MCPFNALTLKIDDVERLPILEKEGFPEWDQVSVVDQEKCIKCTICNDVCPREAVVRDVPAYEGEAKQALKAYEISGAPTGDAAAMYKQAAALSKAERYDEAIRAYDAVLALDPKNALALYNKGVALGKIGRYEEALKAYEAARGLTLDEGARASLLSFQEGKSRQSAIKTKTEFKVDMEKCTVCGICGNLCPAITVKQKPFTAETGKVEGEVICDEAKCDACKVCVEACPEECITVNREVISDKLEGEVTIDKDLCCTCTWCSRNCPTEAITVEKCFDGEIRIDDKMCPAGCSTCVEVCPCNAIYLPTAPPASELKLSQEAKIAVNKDFCMFCGACVNACPGEDIIFLQRSGIRMKGKETDLFNKIKDKLFLPRTSKVKETVAPGEVQVKVLETVR
jgi:formate hydrogenlyase subunit 6/NADH:ubiquinone oxidoreductase subunit I